jgi:hypothetical protein
MNIKSAFKSLCLPSKVYLILSIIAILLTIFLPATFGGVSVIGHIIHFVYVLFWTWVLNLICKAGYKWISWVLVLAPFVLAFVLLALVLNGSAVIISENGL